MMAKEKLIFWMLLPVLAAVIFIGVNVQERKKASTDEFLKDIESVTAKAKSKKNTVKDAWDIEGLKKQAAAGDYPSLMEGSIFFRPVSEAKPEGRQEAIPLKQEEPPKPVFVYKGRMMLGSKVIVIIEDQNTGKSFSVKEGDATGDFTVLSIGEKEIRIKKKDGEEVTVSTVKEEKKEEKEEGLPDKSEGAK